MPKNHIPKLRKPGTANSTVFLHWLISFVHALSRIWWPIRLKLLSTKSPPANLTISVSTKRIGVKTFALLAD
jgi:hypothetical protein